MAESTIQPPPERKAAAPPPAVPSPKRPRRALTRRLGQSFRMWARDTFSPEQLISALKSLAWVAPMTVLIWVYAEREQTSKQPVQFRVEARNNDPNRVVELRAVGPDGRLTSNFIVRADLGGPNARLEHAKEKLEGGGGLQVEIPDLPPGNHPVQLAPLLVNDPSFKEEGLTPTSILPSEIDVFIDPIEHRTVPVRVRSTVTNLEGPAIFKPATVEIVGPRSVLELASAENRLVAYADLPTLTEPGTKSFANVPITVSINDPHVRLSVTTVSADVTVRNPNVEGVVRGVPVLVSYPPGDQWDKFKVQADATIPEVKVTGPAEMIAEVDRPDFSNKPKAFLDLSKADPSLATPMVGRSYKAPLIYEFGNTGLKISPDAPTSLTFMVVERKPE